MIEKNMNSSNPIFSPGISSQRRNGHSVGLSFLFKLLLLFCLTLGLPFGEEKRNKCISRQVIIGFRKCLPKISTLFNNYLYQISNTYKQKYVINITETLRCNQNYNTCNVVIKNNQQ